LVIRIADEDKRMRGFLENNKGNIATVFGFLVFPIVVAIGAGVEFGNVANMRRLVQDAADAGAIAAANKLNVLSQGAAADGVEATGTDTAMFQIKDNPNLTNVSFTTVVDKKTGTVTVNGKATIPSLFNVLPNSSLDFSVNSVAETLNQMPLCVMQLSDNGDDDDMLSMTNQSQLLAGGCLIHSNENIGVSDQASIMASRIQAVGTVKGNTKPGGQGGALKIDDPFKNMDLEFEKICKAHHYGQLKQTGTKTWRLPAGVHCGSNSSTAQMTIILEPGEHYFLKDFKFNGNTQLQGEDVVMIFADGANPKFWGPHLLIFPRANQALSVGFF